MSSLLSASVVLAQADGVELRLRCGDASGPSEASSDGVRQLRDAAFSPERGYGHIGGQPGRLAPRVAPHVEPAWFLRAGPRDRPLVWREGDHRHVFKLSRGRYAVELGFVETEVVAPGLRIFDVLAEDEEVLSAFDIFGEVGDFAWLVRSFEISVRDGWLDLELVSRTPELPARLSSISIRPLAEGEAAERDRRAIAATAPADVIAWTTPSLVHLAWRWPAGGPTIAGFDIERATSPEGPWASRKTSHGATFLVDGAVEPGREYWYRVRARGLERPEGSLGAWSESRRVLGRVAESDDRVLPGASRSMRSLDLSVAAQDLWILARGSGEVPGTLRLLERELPALVSLDRDPLAAGRAKTWRVDMSEDRFRVLGKRSELFLGAETGDFTRLRERLSADFAATLGLASPVVSPLVLRVNGRDEGLRFDIETLGDKMRKRARLDRVGLLARSFGRDEDATGFAARGERIGEAGDVTLLTRFVHELHHLEESEIEPFLRERLYLDRWLDRLAFAAARGELDLPLSERYFLRDSRNGRWEMLQARHRHGDWGLVDGARRIVPLDEAALERVLWPLAERAGASFRTQRSILLSRLFHVPALRSAYLDRLEAFLAGPLSPEAVRERASALGAELRAPALDDPELWPFDGGAAFLGGPDAIARAHAHRVDALREKIAASRARDRVAAREPLVLSALCPAPSEGEPWLELTNRGAASLDPSAYRLFASFDERDGGGLVSGGELPSGATRRVAWRAGRAAGGLVVLARVEAGVSRVADFAFHGYRDADVVSRRSLQADGTMSSWSLATESPRSPATERAGAAREELATLSWEYRYSVERSSAGNTTISFHLPTTRGVASADDEVILRFRAVDAAGTASTASPPEFGAVRLAWDERGYRHFVILEADEKRPRTEFYFEVRRVGHAPRSYPLGAPRTVLALPILPQIEINEVCPRPGNSTPPEGSPSTHVESGGVGEFVELHNRSEKAVSLQGLYLSDDRERPTKWRITEDIVLAPDGYVVFFADGLDRGRHTSFKLSNSGEFVGLFTPPEEGSLQIDALAFRGVAVGSSWGRKQDGTRGFRVWSEPTPGARNVPRVTQEDIDRLREKEARRRQAESAAREGEASTPRDQRVERDER